MEVYGQEIECEECGSTNVIEQMRSRMMPSGNTGHYSVAACRTCGHEMGL